eukprot:GHRR01020497.1.p1 GENE.GHRR01020497.1~~GHRR01020497.1.p1  ORF type:complete len:233 (+),score=56.55 GHRR01020497.1:258-956(+)
MNTPPILGSSKMWEDLRKEARKLEGELDVKLASYAKLCSGFEAAERGKGAGAGAATDQVSIIATVLQLELHAYSALLQLMDCHSLPCKLAVTCSLLGVASLLYCLRAALLLSLPATAGLLFASSPVVAYQSLLNKQCLMIVCSLAGTALQALLLLHCLAVQIARQKAADIEALLQRLSDINHDMSSVIAGAGDARSHTLARHRDILQDLTQVRLRAWGKRTLHQYFSQVSRW